MAPNLLPHDGEAWFYEGLFSPEETGRYFNLLLNNVEWKHQPVKIFGREVLQPRLTAWFADSLKKYRYSGITMDAFEWTKELLEIREKVEKISGSGFNSALLNFYRNGNDSVGWHRDNEKELGPAPVIASVSLGAARKFELRNYSDNSEKVSILLTDGSLLLMKGNTQKAWEHRLPKSVKQLDARINITFRNIV